MIEHPVGQSQHSSGQFGPIGGQSEAEVAPDNDKLTIELYLASLSSPLPGLRLNSTLRENKNLEITRSASPRTMWKIVHPTTITNMVDNFCCCGLRSSLNSISLIPYVYVYVRPYLRSEASNIWHS